MKYYLSRKGQSYGPYSREELQQYAAQGRVSASDLARTEEGQAWLPIGQLIPDVFSPSSPGPLQSWVAQIPASAWPPGSAAAPVPPSLHWAVVLALGWVTCGIFDIIWMLIQSSWVRKIDSNSQATLFYVLYLVGVYGGIVISFLNVVRPYASGYAIAGVLLELGGLVMLFVGAFSIKHSLEEYYNAREPINLRLSGVMVFFFRTLYFQYHFTRIADWKDTGVLRPSNLSTPSITSVTPR
ncbi:MAG: GYF domain-containing protein [Terriglobia bacterium]